MGYFTRSLLPPSQEIAAGGNGKTVGTGAVVQVGLKGVRPEEARLAAGVEDELLFSMTGGAVGRSAAEVLEPAALPADVAGKAPEPASPASVARRRAAHAWRRQRRQENALELAVARAAQDPARLEKAIMEASRLGLDDEEILPAFETLHSLQPRESASARGDGRGGGAGDGPSSGNSGRVGDGASAAPAWHGAPLAVLELQAAVRAQDAARLEGALVAASEAGVADEELLPAFEVLLETTGRSAADGC